MREWVYIEGQDGLQQETLQDLLRYVNLARHAPNSANDSISYLEGPHSQKNIYTN